MAQHVRDAAEAENRSVAVLMDLAGPKLRTGEVEPGPCVLRWRPPRDERGRTTEPARLWLSNGAPPPGEASACVPVDEAWWRRLRVGDAVRFRDIRGRDRRIRIVGEASRGRWAEADRSAWLEPGVSFVALPRGRTRGAFAAPVGAIPPARGQVRLRRGDSLFVSRDPTPGRRALLDATGDHVVEPARIPCTLPEAFDAVRVGEPVWFDDGGIGGVIRGVGRDGFLVEITDADEDGGKLAADKGINLPETRLSLSSLTRKDLDDLELVRANADLVGLSFVGGPDDVEDVWARISGGARPLGIVVKVETRRAFEALPRILVAAMEGFPAGVMIARGDLAVECGFARLAEIQEEILWMCEAAHVPVVWATQVLETLAREGRPTRAEVTDAAMSERAECVMLNKGPYVLRALAALVDILGRMGEHQHKKTARLRPLHVAAHFPS